MPDSPGSFQRPLQEPQLGTASGAAFEMGGHALGIGGRVVGSGTVWHDITERVEAEARLRASEERFRLLIEHGLEVIGIIEADGTIRYMSPSASRVTGYSLDSFAGVALVVSHDRWFLDRVCTHLLAFEDDSKVVWYDGNWSEYAEWRRQTLGVDAERPHRIVYRKLER